MADTVLLSDFTMPIKLDNAFHSKDEPIHSKSNVLSFKIVTEPVLILGKALAETEVDTSNAVGLAQTTMHQLGLFSDSLVSISWVSGKSMTNPKRVAKVYLCDCEEDCVLMLPSLYFNLSQHAHPSNHHKQQLVSIQKFVMFEEDESERRDSSVSTSWTYQLPSADVVHVSVIHSPLYSANHSYAKILQKYFSIPRFLKRKDVLSIPAKFDVDIEARQDVDICFQVDHIQPELPVDMTFISDINRTDLFQLGPVKSYAPQKTTVSPSLHVCLAQYIDELTDILQPYLRNDKKIDKSVGRVLITGNTGCGKTLVCLAASHKLHMHFVKFNCYELTSDTSAATEAKIKAALLRAELFRPCLLVLQNIHCLGKDRDGNAEDARVAGGFHDLIDDILEESRLPVAVIATSSAPTHINSDLHAGFLHQIDIQVPDEVTRLATLDNMLSELPSSPDISVSYIAQRTAGFVYGDLQALCAHATMEASRRAKKIANSISKTGGDSSVVTGADFQSSLDKLQAAQSDAIGAPKIPNVHWDDVGGLMDVKKEILDTINLPLQHPELLAAGLKRSGILLYGPPGTGKTLLAKAVATECSLNFLSVKGPELINMYVGQSEENVREVFSRARSATPCVIFFDELDSLAPNRGRSGDSGGVMDRVVSQLLAELDGLNENANLFVISATNRPDLIDPALLRPGRFDKLIYLSVSNDSASRYKILKAQTRKFRLRPDLDLKSIVDKCPLNLTGADFYALCSDAMLNAVKRNILILQQGNCSRDKQELIVIEEDFISSIQTLVPSVSNDELKHYSLLKDNFKVSKS